MHPCKSKEILAFALATVILGSEEEEKGLGYGGCGFFSWSVYNSSLSAILQNM